MKWVVTGGCGFIGRALIARLVSENGHNVRVLDDLSTGDLAKLEEITIADKPEVDQAKTFGWDNQLQFIEGSILDSELAIRTVEGADVVVHLAANTGVQPSVDNPRYDCETNVFGVLNMLEACRTEPSIGFILASSGAPLGVQTPPLHEEMAAHPASPYGASKLAGEGYCSAYFHSFGVNTVALRFGNVYGEGSNRKESIVAKFINRAMSGEKLEIYGDGSQTRDFIHISDLVNAIYLASTTSEIGGEIFQIATSSETTVLEITNSLVAVFEELGLPRPDIEFGEARTGDVARNFSNTNKAKEKLGWSADVTLDTGLIQTVKSFLV